VNYFQNLQSATLANRSFCLTDPNGWYGPDHWGISRCYGPDGVVRDYTPATGDGTVDPTAALLSLPLTPTESLAAVRSMFFQYKHYIFGIHGFCDGFNVKRNSRAPVADGVDLCASILAVENYRTGMPRTYFMKSPIARQALNAAGFASPSRCTASSSLRSAALACDGDDGTSWESAAFDPQWLQVDLLTAQIIGKVELDWGADYGLSYRIQVSPDGTTWRDVAGTDHGHGGHEALFFAPVTARYVRVYGNQSAAGGGCSVQEMWVLPPAVSGPKAFPNPFRPALGHRAVTLSNLPSGAHVRIHAFSGVLVAELTADAFGSASWNGTNASGAAVASGVYTAVVEGFGEKLKIIVQR
jgi:hypothetical protein